MNFTDILKNHTAVDILKRAAENDALLRHAYLLHGDRGVGKRTLAGIFAASLVCEGAEKPCGCCVPCKKAEKNIHPDIFTVKKPEDKTIIPVDTVRALREFVYIKPNDAQRKIVIIQNAEDMNDSAANALLKVLEEPPAYLTFILTCNNLSLLPQTIVSRCVCIRMTELSREIVEDYLSRQQAETSAELVQQAARYGGGNLGRSLRFLSDEQARENFFRAEQFFAALPQDEYRAAALLSGFDRDRGGLTEFLMDLDICLEGAAFDRYAERELVAMAKLHELILQTIGKLKLNSAVSLTASLFCRQAASLFR